MEAHTKNTLLMTGASGLLGKAVTSRLGQPWKALRHGENGWDPEKGICDPSLLKGCKSVMHLAGEPIAARRWSDTQKRRIYDSRVNGTRALAEAMASLEAGPRILVCASAVGFYGDRGEELLTENMEAGEGFLPEVVQNWETAADPAREAGIRVVHLRLGIVLSAEGGALAKMLPVFKLGLGGRLGNGRMWMSWVHLQDAAEAFVQAVHNPEMQGIYNLCAPSPVRNSEFTRVMGKVLKRPAILPAPAPALRLLLGEMGQSLLLGSTRCAPAALKDHGFSFEYPELEPALHDLLT